MIILLTSIFASISVFLLTLKTPLLKTKTSSKASTKDMKSVKVSVIIPARNEAKNIARLLNSLTLQTYKFIEIIVVDDESTDETFSIAKNCGARVIRVQEGSRVDIDFAPKAFACDLGAKNASGDVYLFLDADTFVSPIFIENIANFFEEEQNQVISLQPFHRTSSIIGSLSFYLHFVSITASGLLSAIPINLGLFGPCIAMRREIYVKTLGFGNEKVRTSLIEDVELSKILKQEKIDVKRYLGIGLIEYEMYSNIKQMFLGWKKNISRGAAKTNPLVLASLIAYIGSLISIPFVITTSNLDGTLRLYILMQFVFLLLLGINVAVRLGKYFLASILYPFSLMFFMFVFVSALFSQVFCLKVRWAGRQLDSKGRTN